MDDAAFLAKCGIEPAALEKGAVSADDLRKIHDDHSRREALLTSAAQSVVDLLRTVPEVHSVRFRIKDPFHLCEKVLRKASEDRPISVSNYRQELGDLVGIRALHLLKEEWRPIHDFICETWAAGTPTAFVREGDSDEWIESLKATGCNVEKHPRKYRSVHYDLEIAPTKETVRVEVQVRTIFEEAWAEIDHRMNYPRPSPWPEVRMFVDIFNRLAGQTDEMASFLGSLERQLRGMSDELEELAGERDEALNEVASLIDELELEKGEKAQLRSKLDKVRSVDQTISAKGIAGLGLDYVPLSSSSSVYGGRLCEGCGAPLSLFDQGPRCSSCTLQSVMGRCDKCGASLEFSVGGVCG